MREINQLAKTESKPRNYSLDLLRIVSMLMIVTLHLGSHGGMTAGTDMITVNGILEHFLIAASAVGVNCFVLISGYFLIDEHFRFKKLWSIVVTTVFYSWLIFALCRGRGIPVVSMRQAVFPISFSQNWFITAYIGLYFLFPIVNQAIRVLNRKQHGAAIVILVILTALWSDVIPSADPFGAYGGYSVVWFLVLYMIAAYVRLYTESDGSIKPFFLFLACSFLVVLSWLIIRIAGQFVPALRSPGLDMYYSRYNSTPILVGSVALFLCFRNLQINRSWVIKLISAVSPTTMGIYLIHDNPNVRAILWSKILHTQDISVTSAWMIPQMVVIVFAVFVVCAVLDEIRLLVFRQVKRIPLYAAFINRINEKVAKTEFANM